MRLKVTKSINASSLYEIKYVYNSKTQSNSSKIVEKLETEVEIREKIKGANPYEWAKEYVKKINHVLHSVAFRTLNRLLLLDRSSDTAAISDSEKPNQAESRPFQQGHNVDL